MAICFAGCLAYCNGSAIATLPSNRFTLEVISKDVRNPIRTTSMAYRMRPGESMSYKPLYCVQSAGGDFETNSCDNKATELARTVPGAESLSCD